MSLNLFKTNDIPKIMQTLEKVAKGHVVSSLLILCSVNVNPVTNLVTLALN
jgi:hypothetical protein